MMSGKADGPIEDAETARKKLRKAGFDPDDVHTARSGIVDRFAGELNVTPMAYFSCMGDLPMCRYLHHIRGAVTTTVADEHKEDPDGDVVWFPIYFAAYMDNYETIKWLYLHGAKSEILKDIGGSSPISMCFVAFFEPTSSRELIVDLATWLVMEGMLEDDTGNTDRNCLFRFLVELHADNNLDLNDMHGIFIGWLEELISPNDAFHTFLLGTWSRPKEDAGAVRLASNNACLAAFPGLLEKIGDYVGIIKNKTKVKRIEDALVLARSITMEEWM